MRKRIPILLLFCLFLSTVGKSQVFKTINVTTPGTLSTLLTENELSTVTDLTITGNIDARDFRTIRDNVLALNSLNIKDVDISAYYGTDGTDGGTSNNLANAIPGYAFYRKNTLTSITLPESATTINQWCFFSNTGITSITIPKSIKTIDGYAFQDCNRLTTLIIDDATVDIGGAAFYNCKLLSNISFGNGEVTIGNGSFSACKSLTNLTIPGSVKSFAQYAFNSCTGLKSVVIHQPSTTISENMFSDCTGLTSVIIPNTIETIGQYAFSNCTSLTGITIPNSVKTIGINSFNNCISISKIVVPDSVTEIASGVFYNCKGLKSVILPSSVSLLNTAAFAFCSALDTIKVLSYLPIPTAPYSYTSNEVFDSVDKSKCKIYIPYKSKNKYLVADQWKEFSNYIENENGVYLESTIYPIGASENSTMGFNIKSNTTWTISSDQTWIKINKLTGTNNDTITVTADANKSIGTRIAKITILDSNNIPQFLSIIQNASQKVINESSGNLNGALSNDEKKIVSNLKLTGTMDARDFKVLRDSLPLLSDLDLSDVAIEDYTGNEGTEDDSNRSYPANGIPQYAFYTNYGSFAKTSLKTISFPRLLNSIGSWSFFNCTGITEIYIPKSVNNIGSEAFSGCTGLKTINVSNRKPVLLTYGIYDNNVFKYVDTLKCILRVPYNTKQLYSTANIWKKFINMVEYPYYLFLNSDTVQINSKTGDTINFGIKSNVSWTASADSTWLKFKSATGVNNDSLILIADSNPYLIPRTTVVRINSSKLEPENITVIQEGRVVTYTITAGNLKTIIPPEIKRNITNIVLNGTMDARDFRVVRDSMPNLVKIDLSKIHISYYKGLDGTIQDSNSPGYLPVIFPANEIPAGAFKRDFSLESTKIFNSVIMPDSVTSIGNESFSGCIGITEVKISELIISIKDGAFENCSGLINFEIPKTVINLGAYVFEGCSNLTSVIINAPITSISGSLFNSCTNLSTLTIPNTITSVGEFAFYGCGSLKSLLLPAGVTSIGQCAFIDCTGLTEFTIPSSVISIGGWCFANCHSLTKIIAYGSKPSNINLGYCVFSIADGNSNPPPSSCMLVVPAGTKSSYSVADQWKDFRNINDSLVAITDPILMVDKMVDGNVNASIIKIGVLKGIKNTDLDNLTVTATAKYDNANVGVNKTITVVYTISGSASWKYPQLENYVITTGKISDYVTLNALATPAPGCEGDNLDLSYAIKTGTPTQYKITFDDTAQNAGLKNIPYTDLHSDNISDILSLPIPAKTEDGTFSGTLKMNNELNVESPDYPFTFTINVSSNYIRTKFNLLVMFDNSANRFSDYQWYKNNIEIAGATKQFYVDPDGLTGSYSLKLTTTNGNTLYSCPIVLNRSSVKAQVTTFPNPVKENEPCTVQLTGLTDDQLKVSKLSVYNIQGICVYETSVVMNLNQFNLALSGAYIGHLTTSGIDYVFKIIVGK